MASSSSAVEGFIDWPPLTTWCTPSERKMRRMPSPVHTATTAQRTGRRRFGPDRRDGRLADPTLLFDLLPQIGDPNLAGPARLDAGLDGGADVVGVDVAVPHPVAADHDDRVARPRPTRHGRRDGLVRRLEEVHDLVAQLGAVVAGSTARAEPPESRLGAARGRAPAGAGHGPAVGDVQEGVEQQHKPGTAGVDHAGRLQDRQQLRGAGQGSAAPRRAASSTSSSPGASGRRALGGLGAQPGPRSGSVPSTGLLHRLVGARRRPGQRVPRAPLASIRGGVANVVGHAPQDLRRGSPRSCPAPP